MNRYTIGKEKLDIVEQDWDIVEKYANKDVIEKRNGVWKLKNNVVKGLKEGGAVEATK